MSHGDADSPDRGLAFVWTIVVAGGAGLRFGSRKQFADLGGRSVLERSVDAAATVSSGVVVVVPHDVRDEVERDSTIDDALTMVVVAGGSTRAESVRKGLGAVPDAATHVLVHDAARPLASPALFVRVVDELRGGARAAIPVVAVADTIRHRDGGVVDRDRLLAVQTPQGFHAPTLRQAHATGAEATDDATLVEALGHTIVFVDGDRANQKLTEPEDLVVARAMIGARVRTDAQTSYEPEEPKEQP